jgi:polyisoprenoid-binding protein YceI
MEKKMVRIESKLAITAFLGIISAIPSLAQDTAWNIDSDHSTARFVLSSSKRPAAKINVGVAQVRGIVIGTADASAPTEFDLTIYPADQDTHDRRSEDRRGESDLQSAPDYTVIAFRSTVIKPIAPATVRVTGNLTVTYVERVATYGPSESYSGPTYGPAITHSERREVTFEFQQIHQDKVSRESSSGAKWSASGVIQSASFPELLRAVESTNWPVLVEDEQCEMPSTTGEDYSGPKCTGTVVGVRPRTDVHCEVPTTTGEGYSGEVCTGTPLLIDPSDSDDMGRSKPTATSSGQLAANEVTIDLDLRLTRPNVGQTSDLVRSFSLFNVHSE